MAAQPFKHCPDDGKDRDAAIAIEPEEPRCRGGGGCEKRKARWQQHDGERQQEGKLLCINQKGIADPVKPQKEIAKAEPPADKPRALHGAAAARPCRLAHAIQQPDENRNGDEENGKQAIRLKRERACGTRHESRRIAPPPPKLRHRGGEALKPLYRGSHPPLDLHALSLPLPLSPHHPLALARDECACA